MSKSADRIIEGLKDAQEIARKASEVAFIIQEAREEDASATRTAYRILGHLGLCVYHEPDAGRAALEPGA
ncbi:MAG TPA: hypothetical protein VJP88_08680 [Caulobacteraceae bacterium]|nr:hypothetical protein [Caulobacteraceae bacterium]